MCNGKENIFQVSDRLLISVQVKTQIPLLRFTPVGMTNSLGAQFLDSETWDSVAPLAGEML